MRFSFILIHNLITESWEVCKYFAFFQNWRKKNSGSEVPGHVNSIEFDGRACNRRVNIPSCHHCLKVTDCKQFFTKWLVTNLLLLWLMPELISYTSTVPSKFEIRKKTYLISSNGYIIYTYSMWALMSNTLL